MSKLLKFELRKLFSMKSLYICMAILAGMVFVDILAIQIVSNIALEDVNSSGVVISLTQTDSYNAAYFLTSTASGCNIDIFLAVMISLFICGDFGCGAMKTIIAKGYARTKVFLSKYIAALFIGLIFAAVAMIFGFLFGGLLFTFDCKWTASIIYSVLLQILMIFAYSSMFFLFSVCFKKLGGAIAVGAITPSVIFLLLSLADAFFIQNEKLKLSDYWIGGAFTNLSSPSVETDMLIKCAIIGIAWIIAFIIPSLIIAKKTEV